MADETQRNPQRMGLHRLAWAAGIIGLPLSHYWLLEKIEPFYSSIYCFLWWSYIFAADFAVWKLRGTSLLRDRPKEFLFLSIWSVPVWMVFEAVNLHPKLVLRNGALVVVMGRAVSLPGFWNGSARCL